MIKNKENITKIVMKPTAITKCVIGQDWYQNNLEIIFIPEDYYPDYMEVESWIMEHIDGKELNVEEAVNNIYQYLDETYLPKHLHVKDFVCNEKTHFDVIVEKESI